MRSIICIVLVSVGCGSDPKINSFNVTPLGYCASTKKIHVDWSTSNGTATLLVEPPGGLPKHEPNSGSDDVDPQDMKLTLAVTTGSKHTQRPPQIVHAIGRHSLNGLVTDQPCTDGWVKTDPASFGGGSNAFDPSAHPTVISNKCAPGAGPHATCRRNVKVIHGSSTWDLAPDSVVDVSSVNVSLSGDWSLNGELLKDESCGHAPDAVELDLDIEVGCKESAQ